jgi:CubicO group peptidase (beta-lactamase class C family)
VTRGRKSVHLGIFNHIMRNCLSFRRSLLLLAILPVIWFSACSQDRTYSPEVENKIREVENNLSGWVQFASAPKWTLAERMKHYHCNGVSIAVIKDYKIEWARGYGFADSAEQRPVTTSTLFLAGSNSKSLNAVGLLKLAQDGKIDLYTDINQYLKTWKFPYDSLSNGKKITIANLLSHTGGLTVHGFPGYEVGDTLPTITEILNGKRPANTAAIRSMYEPGLKSEYSGGGVTISQLVVQDVTGQPYDVWMWENVLKPMGMDLSSYTEPPPSNKASLLATGYYNDGKPVKGKYHIYPEMAAAGLWTNATDLAKYVIETELALEGKSQKVLNRKMTELRLTPYIDKEAAFGVFIKNKDGAKYFTHGGVDEGFVSQYVGSFEGGNGVVVMTNTYNTAMFDEIINSVAKVYDWKNFYQPVVKNEISLPDSVLRTYTGKYKFRNDTLSVYLHSDGLYIDVHSDYLWKMHFTDSTHWFVAENRGDLNFVVDASKRVTGFGTDNGSAQKLD